MAKRDQSMAKVITMHSFRRGTGKSNVAANIAVLLALQGRRVALVDANFNSPGLQTLFSLHVANLGHSFNDYLFEECDIQQAAYDVTAGLPQTTGGRLFVVPASSN